MASVLQSRAAAALSRALARLGPIKPVHLSVEPLALCPFRFAAALSRCVCARALCPTCTYLLHTSADTIGTRIAMVNSHERLLTIAAAAPQASCDKRRGWAEMMPRMTGRFYLLRCMLPLSGKGVMLTNRVSGDHVGMFPTATQAQQRRSLCEGEGLVGGAC